jgi:YhcH/YjgK/YiaL family protein
MIVTDLHYVDVQVSLNLALTRAIEFLRLHDILDQPDGTLELDGKNLFAIIQRYDTIACAAPRFEYHRKYIDVQYIAAGEEVIGWAPTERMNITEPYDETRDICFGTVAEGEWKPVSLRAGQLAIFYPEDAHAPRLLSAAPSRVMKIVVKAAV